MELTVTHHDTTVVVLCPAGCFHVQPARMRLLVLHPDTRDPQLLIPFTPTSRPCPN